MPTKCIFLEETNEVEDSLRRYKSSSEESCSASGMGYHDAQVKIGRRPEVEGEAIRCVDQKDADPRWPKNCACGYEFKDTDIWQRPFARLFRRSDTGELTTLRDAPVGAMWYASWYSDSPEYCGEDGKTLVVRLPGKHDWIVDSRASNCDSPCTKCGKGYKDHFNGYLCNQPPPGAPYDPTAQRYEDAHPHKCWVRHGAPPEVHVDKNGETCGAGAGSIAVPGYHGFLHNGHLTDG